MMNASGDTAVEQLLLSMRGIVKHFPGVHALRAVDLELREGEVLAVLGENGAGKSTLIKVLGGAHLPEEGSILIDGGDAEISNPQDAQRAGIAVIYQEFNLVPSLSATENIFLGQERTSAGFLHRREEIRRALQLFTRIGVEVDPRARCRDLSVAQQQVVEIAKALHLDARIIVMDEPSATLTPREVERLFVIIRELKAQGLGVIYISHRLDEIFEIADRVFVLRDGNRVDCRPIDGFSRDELIECMVGRKLENEFPQRNSKIGERRLVVENLQRGSAVRGVSFHVHRGEILGITGLVGAGRTEMARLVFGADERDSGVVELDGRQLEIRSPREAIRQGICLLVEDRKADGLVLGRSAKENFALPNLGSLSSWGFLLLHRENALWNRLVDGLRINAYPGQLARNLSGGNQQKVVLAKWLQRNCEVIFFDEPTRGIDVGAKYEIYVLIRELAAQGKSIIMISSELPEILGMSDRIVVMHEGRISGEITDVEHATQEQIMRLAVG
jgi:ABC-type sugar transport system ATPase subunit